jgi:hypothetical protein
MALSKFIISDGIKPDHYWTGSTAELLMDVLPHLVSSLHQAKKRPGISMPGQPHYQQESYFALVNSG